MKDEYTLTVNVDGQDIEYTVNLGDFTPYADAISPVSLSPVLESELTIQLNADYTEELDAEDFRAELNLVSEITQGHWVFNYQTA